MSNFELAKNFFLEGLSDLESRRYEDAEIKLRRSLELLPDRVSTLTNLSAALIRLQKYADAEFFLKKIISLDPGAAEAWLNLGLIEVNIRNDACKALACFDTALEVNPDYAEAWVNRGLALQRLRQPDKAAESYERAMMVAPAMSEAYAGKARLNFSIGAKEQALDDFKKAYAADPELDYLLGDLLYAKASVCDWSQNAELLAKLESDIERGLRCTPPLNLIALMDSPALQKKVAESWVNDRTQGACF